MTYPKAIVPVGHIEPVPRRIRATLAGTVVLDTVAAIYLWESANYPHYYVPFQDLDLEALVNEARFRTFDQGPAHEYGLRVGVVSRPAAVRVHTDDAGPLAGLARVEWDGVDEWYEEDEQVFVHPRSPYTRVDALRSTRQVRVELDGIVLAESSSPVMVFETGLPTRYYFNRTDVRFDHLVPSQTQTPCPYKGVTSGYWSSGSANTNAADLAWTYDFPTRQLLPIAGLIAFYNEKVDTFIDGELLDRPVTHFS